jgi:hypothetical protein
MSRITLKGWLKIELARLAGQDTASIHRLATLAKNHNSRIYEPLLVYALETGAANRLMAYLDNGERKEEYRAVVGICGNRSILELKEPEVARLPWSYQKLLHTWRSVEQKAERIERSKRMRLDKTRELMKEKNVSNAQIYRALNLNPGNTNAYLKHGDISKLSIENTTRVMRYLYALQEAGSGQKDPEEDKRSHKGVRAHSV